MPWCERLFSEDELKLDDDSVDRDSLGGVVSAVGSGLIKPRREGIAYKVAEDDGVELASL